MKKIVILVLLFSLLVLTSCLNNPSTTSIQPQQNTVVDGGCGLAEKSSFNYAQYEDPDYKIKNAL